MEYKMRPIGTIHSPFQNKADTPIQASRSEVTGHIEVHPDYGEGLKDIEGFSYIIMLYVFHQSSGYDLLVKPFLDDELHGIFSIRYPRRPNPIGISTVELLAREENVLHIKGVDVLDGTPLLDIKPYIFDFDHRPEGNSGWFAARSKV